MTAPPTIVGDPPPDTHAPRPGYAVGSAPVPHPPTMIEPGMPQLGVEPDALTARRMPRPLLGGLVGAVVVLGVALTIVTAMLLSRTADKTAQPAQSGPPTQIASAGYPSVTASAIPTASTAQAIADQLDATIADALAAGRIDSDAADQLRDKLNDLRRDAGRGKARKTAQDLQKKINELHDDGQLDDHTADQLTTLL